MNHFTCFTNAEILLPDFSRVNGTAWSVVACDQYTSEPDYWARAEEQVGSSPSTLRLMLPEIFLEKSAERIPQIHAAMEQALQSVLKAHPNAMIYLERTQSDGRIRRGVIGAVDLESYDYHKGSASLIRATEGTVLERIPPRVAVRRGAPIELPHVMLLIDDPRRTAIEACAASASSRTPVYDFDLMLGGGRVKGWLLNDEEQAALQKAFAALSTPEAMTARYGDGIDSPLLFAVGDGNHSLATAKAAYEELRATLSPEELSAHPARYALAEVVNLHDEALEFEPIYRAVFRADVSELLQGLNAYLQDLNGTAAAQELTVVTANGEETISVPHPVQQLAVGTLQTYLDEYLAAHPEATVDYIHGEESLRRLIADGTTVGFLFKGMQKSELFETVLRDGALPRKTFSMGHAEDKRYYLECRRIL